MGVSNGMFFLGFFMGIERIERIEGIERIEKTKRRHVEQERRQPMFHEHLGVQRCFSEKVNGM